MSPPAKSKPPIALPARISKYELLEFLGGGMSHVFRARDTILGRTVAIKILTPSGVADPDTKARFLQEARTASNIAHENILAVYDFGEDAGRPFMVMEFLRGSTLRAAIQDHLLPDIQSRLRIAIQIARALIHVHRNSIIHRDVKPENINIDDTGRAKLMDFGIAKAIDVSLTQPGYVLGTPYYMAPEQIMGKPVTPAVDIYAFGIMLYEMMLGNRPYTGETVETIFYKILHEPLDLQPLAQAGVPGDIIVIVGRCTRKDPASRYPDFTSILADLEKALAPPQQQVISTPSKTLLFAGIGALAVILIAAIAWWATNYKPTPKPPPRQDNKIDKSEIALADRIDTPTGPMRLIRDLNIYMDETEVSNLQYAEFCKAANHPLPATFDVARPMLPIVDITIADARAYAAWAGKRLPNAQQWERAARGKNGFTYPWGYTKEPARANVADNPNLEQHVLRPVDDFAESASPYHIINMVGNALEFIDEPVTPSPQALQYFATLIKPPATASEPWVTIRGGSFDTPLDPSLVADAQSIPERWHFKQVGFRCVKPAQ